MLMLMILLLMMMMLLMMMCGRRFFLPEYLPYAGIFHERGQPGLATHSSVNRVLAGKGITNTKIWSHQSQCSSLMAMVWSSSGASIGDGQSAVASNIANTTYRLQWWDFTKFDLPEVSNGTYALCSSVIGQRGRGEVFNNSLKQGGSNLVS